MVMEIIISVILLIVGIAVLIIIHVCVVGRAFRGDQINGRNSNPVRAERIPGLNPEDIKELPCFDYNMEEINKGPGNENVECAVCLENFKAGESCRILPKCNHIFHGECIDSWLVKTGACPICRTGAKSEQNSTSSSYSGEAGVELANTNPEELEITSKISDLDCIPHFGTVEG
ncbi:hypothetical protein DH2020_019319 [Rehmannia glutinosa]|uniref:RING-type domain-containing protein n=1 Tax=Rehmannia glutinosa TaxID=99300 RepID=A0ABR0WPZ5_REHGL